MNSQIKLVGGVVIVLVLIFGAYVIFNRQNAQDTDLPTIQSFQECVAAGNPVMESYPRQCAANGVTYTEVLQEMENKSISFTKVIEGDMSDVEEKQTFVLKTQAELNATWEKLIIKRTEVMPTLNNTMILTVFAGSKPHPGYTIEITQVIESTQAITVYVKEGLPSSDGGYAAVITNPYYLAQIPLSDKPVSFVFE